MKSLVGAFNQEKALLPAHHRGAATVSGYSMVLGLLDHRGHAAAGAGRVQLRPHRGAARHDRGGGQRLLAEDWRGQF